MRTNTNPYVYILAGAAVLFCIGAIFLYASRVAPPIIFSERTILPSSWRAYKQEYVEADTGRTLDKQQNNITTSEGQSYTLLRAVWMDDKEAFDKSLRWSNEILGRPDDELFQWLFGQRSDGTYGILTERGGQNTASDADVDIALALVFAYARWREDPYLNQARAIINDIWNYEVVVIDGTPYLTANNLEKNSDKEYVIVNPSYLAPYAYRVFSMVDPNHPWMQLVDSSYQVLQESIRSPLDKQISAGLAPDWIIINRSTGRIGALPNSTLTTNYGFDALRVPWRIALDWQWYSEPRARQTLGLMGFLGREWDAKHRLQATYNHEGAVLRNEESPAMYAGSLGYFLVQNHPAAEDLYKDKLLSLYSPDKNDWKEHLNYYDSNWVWFGIGLYTEALPNLARNLPPLQFD